MKLKTVDMCEYGKPLHNIEQTKVLTFTLPSVLAGNVSYYG